MTVCIEHFLAPKVSTLHTYIQNFNAPDLAQRVEVAEVRPLEAVKVAVAPALGQGAAGG